MLRFLARSAALTALVVQTSAPTVRAQDGANDATYNIADDGTFGDGNGPNDAVECSAVLPDGRILIGGYFTTYNGTVRNRIARLNADGSLDTSFDPGVGLDDGVHTMVVQPDGRILIGGDFNTTDGVTSNGLARLNPNGTRDTLFTLGASDFSLLLQIALQPDGKVLIAGYLSSYEGVQRQGIARVNSDGSLDATFDAGAIRATNQPGTPYDIALQSDGKILIAGWFTSVGGVSRNRIARLNSDGSVDPSFDPGAGANNQVHAVAVQQDGHVLIGGEFTAYDGTSQTRIARLLPDGRLDSTFATGSGFNLRVNSIAVQPDGRALTSGRFTSYDGVSRRAIALLNLDGSLDPTFASSAGVSSFSVGRIETVSRLNNGMFIIGGSFGAYDGLVRPNCARISPAGDFDATFNEGTGASSTIADSALLPDGKLLIAGAFDTYAGTVRSRVARLEADGSLDVGFAPTATTDSNVTTISALPDGRVLLAGGFTQWGGVSARRMLRLNPDGSRDATFVATSGPNNWVYDSVLQSDGKAILVGLFTGYSFTPRYGVMRLNVDGSLDTTFDPGLGSAGNALYGVALDAADRVLVAGGFTQFGGTARRGIARLFPDGTVDPSFDTSMGPSGFVRSLALLPDGRILIGGGFTSSHGMPRAGLALLGSDGSLDLSFDPGLGPDGYVYTVTFQPDGKFLVTGDFENYAGVARPGFARVRSDGSLDTTFDPSVGPNGRVQSIRLRSDGRALISGGFTQYDGVQRNHIARIQAFESFTSFCSGDGTGLACPCGNSGAPGNGCANSVRAAGASLVGGGTASITADTLLLSGSGMPNAFALYFQGTAAQNAGIGTRFGDGIRCVSGSVTRLGIQQNVAGASAYPAQSDLSVSVRGGVAAPGQYYYQVWYRNAAAFCTAGTFNLTNGLRIVWTP